MRLQIRQTHAVALLAALSIAAIVISTSLLILQLRNREIKRAWLETQSLTKILINMTQQHFDSVDLVLQGVQERLMDPYGRKIALDSPETNLLLGARASGMNHLNSIFLVSPQGFVLNSSRKIPLLASSVADREYFKAFEANPQQAFFIGPPVRSRTDNAWTVHIARPIYLKNEGLRGIVVASINLADLEKSYEFMQLDYQRPIGLYLSNGLLVASFPHRETAIGANAPEFPGDGSSDTKTGIRLIRQTNAIGDAQLLAIGRLDKYPLLVSVSDDERLSLASWREAALPVALSAVLVSTFTATLAWFLIRKLRSREAMAIELEAANELYHHTVNSVMDAIVAVDEFQTITLFNPAAEQMFEMKANDAIGKSLQILIPEALRARHHRHFNEVTAQGTSSRTMAPGIDVFGQRANGTMFPIESTISKSRIGGKLQMTAVLRDVTEQRRAEIELHQLNRQLRKLASTLQTVREEERTRISRELHDDLGQQLTGLKLSLSWLSTRIKEGRNITNASLDEMRHLLDTAIGSVRRISTELRPPVLDDLGLGEAIAWQSQEFSKHSKLEVSLNLAGAAHVQDDAIATALFRIVQEALTNVVRHANATHVDIEMVSLGENLILTIADNGQGLPNPVNNDGIGLVSMRERAAAAGAKFRIFNRQGAGTCVEVILPQPRFQSPGNIT